MIADIHYENYYNAEEYYRLRCEQCSLVEVLPTF
jgi:hypothetical protein